MKKIIIIAVVYVAVGVFFAARNAGKNMVNPVLPVPINTADSEIVRQLKLVLQWPILALAS